MAETFAFCETKIKPKFRILRHDIPAALRDNSQMAKRTNKPSGDAAEGEEVVPPPVQKHFLREWRILRGMSQLQFASDAGVSNNFLSQIESGQRGLSTKWIYDFAETLGINAGFLFMDPEKLDTELLRRLFDMSDRAKLKTISFIDNVLTDDEKRSGTHG